jgi:hypothetical protein
VKDQVNEMEQIMGAIFKISRRKALDIMIILALAIPTQASFAQGVPVIDGTRLSNIISRISESTRDAISQGTKLDARGRQNALYQEQLEAYERFLADTTGITDLSQFEEAGPGWESATDTYPVNETHPDAARLFGENQSVERMIITVARRYETHPGVAAAGLNPLTWRILFQSLIKQESRFNNGAVSPVGARGFCQLMPGTASDLGVNPYNPMENLDGGARYILRWLERWSRIDYALAAYNAGPGRVIEYGGVPPFEETQTYVRRINGYYNDYLSVITGADMIGSLDGLDGASAQWGNWSDASMGYGAYMGGQIDQSMTRIAALLRQGQPEDSKAAMDHNTYMLAERARLMALTLRLRSAHVMVEAGEGMVDTAENLELTTFWRYKDE